MLEEILGRIMENNFLLMLAFIILVLLVIFLLKKLFKWVFGLLFIAAVGLVILYFTTDNPRGIIEEAIDKSEQTVKEVQKKARQVSKDIDNLKDKVEEKLPDK